MPFGLWVVIGWMIFVSLSTIVMIVRGAITGQFKDIEAAKYRMLEDREPEEWPGRAQKGAGKHA